MAQAAGRVSAGAQLVCRAASGIAFSGGPPSGAALGQGQEKCPVGRELHGWKPHIAQQRNVSHSTLVGFQGLRGTFQ